MIDWLLLPPLALLLLTTLISGCGFVVQAAEKGEPVRVSPRSVAVIVREAIAHALFCVIAPIGVGQPAPPRRITQDHRPPVLLLTGYSTNRSSMAFLRIFLQRRGWACVWTVNGGSRSNSISQRAALLADRVAQLKHATGADQVDLVAFSTGGLVAAWYLRHLDGAEHVRRLVAIGTPWRGTRMAVFARHASAREILFGSHVLDGLQPPTVPTLCIWSSDDLVVVPASSAVADGVQNVRLDAAGHLEMLVSARVYRAVQQALTHPLQEPGT